MTRALTRPLRDPQTYRNLAYLALSLPLGLLELAFLLIGLALALVLLVTLLGVAVLGRTVDGAFALARFERRLAARLLGAEIPVTTPRAAPEGASIPRRLRICFSCETTWQRLGYLVAKLPLAALTVALAGAALTLSLTLLAAPLYRSGADALAAALLGAVALPAALHLVNALARVWARLGTALLPAAA
jgi:hypothetical protein